MFVLKDEAGAIAGTTTDAPEMLEWLETKGHTVTNIDKDAVLNALENLAYRVTEDKEKELLIIAYTIVKRG